MLRAEIRLKGSPEGYRADAHNSGLRQGMWQKSGCCVLTYQDEELSTQHLFFALVLRTAFLHQSPITDHWVCALRTRSSHSASGGTNKAVISDW